MPKIKLDHIVSCSSEDPDHVANNLLNSETKKKWKSKNVGESSASVIFQLEKSTKISGIDIGNENSSFVEVLVGRSSSQEQDYKIMLAMSSFMTPMEARNLTNNNRVRMFTYDDLASSIRDEKWDRVKVVCTQPFNKHVQYGLSFITLHTTKEHKPEDTSSTLGKFTLRPESPNVLTAGSLFAKRKEIDQNTPDTNITVAQAIKTSDKPKRKAVNIQPPASSTSKASSYDAEERDRKRKALFYDSDDEAENERIDKVIEKAKAEEEKKKAETKTPKKPPVKKKTEDTKNSDSPKPSSSAKKEKKDINDTPGTSKRKIDTTPKITNKKRKTVTKPFNELLSGVVFTISGIVNPERANLRTLALCMGAKYRPDWDNTCTHLMCAFANTPKFNQVQGKGKIITKSWIKDCFDQRKRLPWRRYALDRNDQGKPESEDEIEEAVDEPEEINVPVEVPIDKNDNSNHLNNPSNYLSGSDTDDEIEKILAKQKKNKTTNNENNTENNKNDSFDVDTEEEELKKNPVDVEEIPKIFKSEIFYIDDVFDEDEKNKIQRLIKAFDGVVLTSLRNIVDFVITNEESAAAVKERSSAKCVRCTWIYECHDILKRIPFEKFLLDSV